MFTHREHAHHIELLFHAPESANALSLAGARELTAWRRTFAKDPRPVVIRSLHPSVFCSGGNLRDHQQLRTRAAGLRANAEIARHLAAFARWPVPKLAVVAGRALGGGVEWLARFDARWMTPEADLVFHQKRVGLSFGWGGGAAWANWIGEARVRQLLLEARVLDAPTALRLGLADRIVASPDLDGAIEAWARDVASPINGELTRWSVRRERAVFAKLWWGSAHRAALNAFRPRSKP